MRPLDNRQQMLNAMSKEIIGIRIELQTKLKLEHIAEANQESVSKTIRRAIDAFLSGDTSRTTLEGMNKRLTALESKFERLQDKPVSKAKESRTEYIPPHERDDFGELITKEEASEMTGYAVGSLSRTLSVKGIHIKSRDGKKGLYSKAEIMDKIGYNDPADDPRRRTN